MARQTAQGGARASFSGPALVIEDDALIALNLQDMLQDFGFAPIDIAHTATEAEQCAKARYAFAVVDIKLSDGDSFAAASALHANGTPFVFTSGYAERVALSLAFANVPYLTKPFEEGDLREALRLLKEKSAGP